MTDSEPQTGGAPAPNPESGAPPAGAGGAPSTPRGPAGPDPTNGGPGDSSVPRYASEARAELVTLFSTGPSVRNGDSDRVEVGEGYEEYGPQSYVQGTDRLDVGGNYTEHTGSDGITQSTRMSTTVQGHLNLKGKGDTGILGGTLVDTHVGPEFLAAGMSDDLVIGVGVRTTVAGDLWLCGLMGMEEKIGTAAMDGALVELYGLSFEREFGAGLHNSGSVTFSGPLFLTAAAGFRPLLKAMSGPRNLTPGAGAPAGGASSSPPPATPGAGGGGMLMDPAVASGADAVAGAEDTEDARHLLVVADVHVDAAPARTGETADNLADAQRLAEVNEAAESGGTADAAEASADFFRRLEAEGLDDQRRLADTEDAADRPVIVADGNEENVLDDLLEQQIDYPDNQHVDQAGDGADPPPAAVDGLPAGGDGGAAPEDPVYGPHDLRQGPEFPERHYYAKTPRVSADPGMFSYQEIVDFTGPGRWDKLLSRDAQATQDGHAARKMIDTQSEVFAYVDKTVADLIKKDPVFYGTFDLDNAASRSEQYQLLGRLRDSFAASDDPQMVKRSEDIREAMEQINQGAHTRLYAGLEDAERGFVLRKRIPEGLEQDLLTEMLAKRSRQLQDELADLDMLTGRTAEETAQMMAANHEMSAIDGALREAREGYDPLYFLDGLIELRQVSTNPEEGLDEYRIARLDVERMMDSMTPIRQGLANTQTTGVDLTRFDFKKVESDEVMDVIRNNKGTLGDIHIRADTAADHLAAELRLGETLDTKNLLLQLEAEKADLEKTGGNAERLQDVQRTIDLLEKHRDNPYALNPGKIEELIHLELSNLSNMPETPENTARIIELNNALVMLDQRMRIIMSDGLLWADQVGADPKKAINLEDRAEAAQTAWVMTQKSESHMRMFLETGDTYELHLSNMYDLAARDLRRNLDPTDTLEGLNKAPYMDAEVQKAAGAVRDDLKNTATGEAASEVVLTPGIIAEAKYRDSKRPWVLDPALHLEEYWNPRSLAGDRIDPSQSGPRKWWKSLKGIKKRVGNALTTIRGIHAPDRYGQTWKYYMLNAGTSGADAAPRRLEDLPRSVGAPTPKFRKNRGQDAANAPTGGLDASADARGAVRQNLDVDPPQLVPETARAGPENVENALPPAPIDETEGAGAPVRVPEELDDPDDAFDNELLTWQSKYEAMLEAMEVYVPHMGVGEGVTGEQARIERNLWHQLGTVQAEGYDPWHAFYALRKNAQEADGPMSEDSYYAFLRVEEALRHLEKQPELHHLDYKRTMHQWNKVALEDRAFPHNEAYFHMQQAVRDCNQAAQDALREVDPSIPPENLERMEFNEVIDQIHRVYNRAAENGDTDTVVAISRVLDDLDARMTDILTQRDEQAELARAKVYQELPAYYRELPMREAIKNRADPMGGWDTIDAFENPRGEQLQSKERMVWHQMYERMRYQNIDPEYIAQDFLTHAILNEAPADEIALYRGMVDDIVAIKAKPRNHSMEAFPDATDRVYVLDRLSDTRAELAAEQARLDPLDPVQAERYRLLEFEISIYDELVAGTSAGKNPLAVLVQLNSDADMSARAPGELETFSRLEARLKEMVDGPDAKLLEAPVWFREGQAERTADLAAGNQAAAARMETALQQINAHTREVLLSYHPMPDNGWVRNHEIGPLDYVKGRKYAADKMETGAARDFADLEHWRPALEEIDNYVMSIMPDAFVSAAEHRFPNQRKVGDVPLDDPIRQHNAHYDDIDPDDYLDRIVPYREEARDRAFRKGPDGASRKPEIKLDPNPPGLTPKERAELPEDRLTRDRNLHEVPSGPLVYPREEDDSYRLLDLEVEIWDTIMARLETHNSEPLATAQDLLAKAEIEFARRPGTTPEEIAETEETLQVYRKVITELEEEILPTVARKGEMKDTWFIFRPGGSGPGGLGWDDPLPTEQIILHSGLGSDAFLDEAVRREQSGGVESVEKWFNSQSARFEEMRTGDGDLLVQPGGGARDLPPNWKPPADIENPQPTLDAGGARWGDGGPVPDIDEAEFPVVPVREKPRPRPDDAGAAPPPAGNKRPQPDTPYDAADQPPLGPDELGGAGPGPPPDNKRPRPDNPHGSADQRLGNDEWGGAGPGLPPDNKRPRPDSGGAPSAGPGDGGSGDVPAEAGPTSEEDLARQPLPPTPDESPRPGPAEDGVVDEAYVPVEHRGDSDDPLDRTGAPILPADRDRPKVTGERFLSTRFDAFPPDQPGGKYYIAVNNKGEFTNAEALLGPNGSLWGADPEHTLRVHHPDTGALMDPSDYEIRVGEWTEVPYRDDEGTLRLRSVFKPEKTYAGTLSRPVPQSEVDMLLDAAKARRKRPKPPPEPPTTGRQRLNLDAVLDAVPRRQNGQQPGEAAGTNAAGGVFYPHYRPDDTRGHPMPLPDGMTLQDRYRDLAASRTANPDAVIGSEAGVDYPVLQTSRQGDLYPEAVSGTEAVPGPEALEVPEAARGPDYVLAPPSAKVVPEVPRLIVQDETIGIPGIVLSSRWVDGVDLPVVRLEKAHQDDILAGAPLKVVSPDGSKRLTYGEYSVELAHGGEVYALDELLGSHVVVDQPTDDSMIRDNSMLRRTIRTLELAMRRERESAKDHDGGSE